ncbi:nucleoside phosphorylase [Mucilaginibacter sp.]|jgi:uridine phosphorylase|uniref:nucleoside phosphorylase n=1 Tax=Mucilaginibacter sp. TaxID=1882438 RepID=UPI002C89EDC1|nr:nucleoside phosphorylase [Mucilaginibacter sp.]HTI58241.1 nucleoside phosphorylase [Mucilaginibacter sp.]
MSRISETDLILNADGSVYHLNLLPGDIADTVITVGDPERVGEVSKYFDRIEFKKSKREFTTHTGATGGKRITVLSTGIGTDNIDIVMNELDALVNVDLQTRQPKKDLKSLNIIRIGTSGAVQASIPVDSMLVSEMAFGMDTLMHYYRQNLSADEQLLLNEFRAALPKSQPLLPYAATAEKTLLDELAIGLPLGITVSAPGFYAPQGRRVRAKLAFSGLMEAIQGFSFGAKAITNLEMETAGIYGMASVLGHRAISFNVILANRVTQQFSGQPQQVIDASIRQVLERLTVLK